MTINTAIEQLLEVEQLRGESGKPFELAKLLCNWMFHFANFKHCCYGSMFCFSFCNFINKIICLQIAGIELATK